ncbi:unnamed protein product [Vitrella brassicaformis CCMP3155]|uniref:Sugar fermentation stimulation protein C-terminal domain-containing protein n=1 Tax=Vitrella brassicaformis (strain CCMP3155) TaxID=1169540 RepID=A0A0G4F8Q7_VITBC|nr:unnamed protein product [Vitrella brassicaformis CCMP3155]|eukprot:CEM08569.1 unnamed protein product [Vitrella brassicaformis CCMP3155]
MAPKRTAGNKRKNRDDGPAAAAAVDDEHELLPPAEKRAATDQPAASAAASASGALVLQPGSDSGEPLLDLGDLLTGRIVKRPSAVIKTPYVADVRILEQDAMGNVTCDESADPLQAHCPSLDCAGMIVPGSQVRMTPSASGKGKTSHTIWLAEEPRPMGEVASVGAHPQLAERMVKTMLERHMIPELAGYSSFRTQVTHGKARVDFVLDYPNGDELFLEVKNCVCADYPEGQVPSERSSIGVYTSSVQPYRCCAIFPHGAKKPKIKVVSDRAIKHAHELTNMVKRTTSKPRAAILFIVNRSDTLQFRPCHEADMLFAQVLKRAHEAGVQLLAYRIAWDGGRARSGGSIPVVFDESVDTGAIDESHLKDVLQFNAEGGGRT